MTLTLPGCQPLETMVERRDDTNWLRDDDDDDDDMFFGRNHWKIEVEGQGERGRQRLTFLGWMERATIVTYAPRCHNII